MPSRIKIRGQLKVGLCHVFPLFIALLLGGCLGVVKSTSFDDVPLPAPESLNCCWQALEQLTVETDDKQVQLQSVVVVQPGALKVFILDNLGRQLLTVNHDDQGIHTQINQELDQLPPVEWLIVGIYLSQDLSGSWPLVNGGWQIEQAEQQKILMHHGREIVRVIFPDESQQGWHRKLIYSQGALKVQVNRLSWNEI